MPDSANTRPIRSFIRREGRLTPGQQRALEELWSKYGLNTGNDILNLPGIFSHDRPVILEIGFGNGELLATVAQQHPDKNFLGIEVHRPGVGHLLLKLEEHSINNVRVICQDAIEVLSHSIPEHSLEAVWLFFPDPWPKKKHHKRRIVNQEFLDLVARALTSTGHLHLATDWQDYAEHMISTVSSDPRFILMSESTAEKGPSLLDGRPGTKFERRGRIKGHAITDLVYRLHTP